MTDKASATRGAAVSSPTSALSPIIQLLPTGYRDVQPFQRGQGWHSNGKAATKLRKPRDTDERVVFPVIPNHSAAFPTTASGPNASHVLDRENNAEISQLQSHDDGTRDSEDSERRAMSPPASAIPVPPSVPRRPTSAHRPEGNQRASSSGFRSRVLAASPRNSSDPTKTVSANTSHTVEVDDEPPPDPATMEKLWQEYAERTKNTTKTVDAPTYHRRMQHKYNETKALRERITQLEIELEDTQRERDEARVASLRLEQRSKVNNRSKDDDNSTTMTLESTSEETPANTKTENGLASVVSRLSISHKLQQHQEQQVTTMTTEEKSYRERYFKLERTLATTKESIAQLQARLTTTHETDRETIDSLRAQLQLEQQASKFISVQLREIHAAFRSTADQLVTTQVALDKEKIEKQIVVEQIQAETRQLISDHKRKELQSRVKNVVRTLGKEALNQKMEALHTRVLTAEHHMRAAQLEVTRLQQERDLQQRKLDEILASREIKYHVLAHRDGGVPGILHRATQLYHGTRTVDDQFLLVQMLYEDNRPAIDPASNQDEPPSDPEDGYCIHILVYDAFTAQDDYLTFHLRDIHRLVPDADKYLARYADRRHERFLALAELLLVTCRIGFKNGHIVLTERPTSAVDEAARERKEVPIYRGYRYVPLRANEGQARDVLVDLVVNEVCNPSMSQLWWLEIQAVVADEDSNQGSEIRSFTVDSQLLKSIVGTFASYRPSDCLATASYGAVVDDHDLYAIHEDLLQPLFDRLEWQSPSDGLPGLTIVGGEAHSIVEPIASEDRTAQDVTEATPSTPSIEATSESTSDTRQNVEVPAPLPAVSVSQRVLDHRSIMSAGDKFFCVRIQEVWDGELMLRIVMEEPDDTMHRHEATLHERDIMEIAIYLHGKGLCDADYANVIKYGLPVALHDPICRLLKKYVRPGDPSIQEDTSSKEKAVVERISLTALLEEIQRGRSTEQQPVSTGPRSIALPEHELIQLGRKHIKHVSVGGDLGMNDDQARLLLAAAIAQVSQTDRVVLMERFGCRFTDSSGYALVTAYTSFAAPVAEDIVVIDISPVSQSTDTASNKPELILTRGSVYDALVTLGFRVTVDQDR